MEQEKGFKQIQLLIDQNNEINSWFHNLFLKQNNTSYFLKQNIAKPIEVALDTIGDTLHGIGTYVSSGKKFPNESGCYLEIYGLLQLIFVQQDAVRYLTCLIKKAGSAAASFNFDQCVKEYQHSSSSKEIRGLRNTLVGHPQDCSNYWGQIIRMTLKTFSFTSVVTNKKTMETNSEEHDLLKLIECHLTDTLEVMRKAKEAMKKNVNVQTN